MCDQVWESVVLSSASVPNQLASLERIVADIEMAIPTGTVARQLNLKVVLARPGMMTSMDGSVVQVRGLRTSVTRWINSILSTDRSRIATSDGAEEESGLGKEGVGSGHGIKEMLMGAKWAPSELQLKNQSIESLLDRSVLRHCSNDPIRLNGQSLIIHLNDCSNAPSLVSSILAWMLRVYFVQGLPAWMFHPCSHFFKRPWWRQPVINVSSTCSNVQAAI